MIGIMLNGNVIPNDNAFIPCIVRPMVEIFGEENVVIIEGNVKSKIKKLLDMPNLKFESIWLDLKDWKEYTKHFKKIIKDNNITNLILVKTVMLKGYKCDDMYFFSRFFKSKKDNDKYGFSFIQSKRIYVKMLFISLALRYCKSVIQFVQDPQEPDYSGLFDFKYNYIRTHILKDYNTIYMPCYEYGLKLYTEKYDKSKKDLDFVFMCSVYSDDRNFILKRENTLMKIKNSVVQINKKLKEGGNKPLPQNEYYGLLARSRYSLCIKPYDKESFSIMRFFEALYLDCLCFISDDCNLTTLKDTFPDIYEIISKSGIIVNYTEIQGKIDILKEQERYDIIKKIKETESFRKINSFKFISKRWKKLLRKEN